MAPDEIRDLIRLTSNQSTQRQYAALDALGTALGGIEEMKKYGFYFELVPGTMAKPQEWPKMVYHQAGEGEAVRPPVVVENQDELDALGDGWSEKQGDAQLRVIAPTETQRPTIAQGNGVTDPTLVPPQVDMAAPNSGGANSPPLTTGEVSDEARDKAKAAGQQAKKDGAALSDGPDGLLGDAWREGYTTEAAWEQHDQMEVQPPHSDEEPPPAAT